MSAFDPPPPESDQWATDAGRGSGPPSANRRHAVRNGSLALGLVLLLGAGVLLGPGVWRAGQRLLAGAPTTSAPVQRPADVGAAEVDPPAPPLAAEPSAAADPGSAVDATGSPSPEPTAELGRSVLRLTGPVPAKGRGTFGYASGTGPVLGQAGTVRRYRVAVEHGGGEDVAEFGAAVDRTLGEPGSWIGSGRLRLQRVSGPGGYDFTVYLATRETARRMCAEGGVDIRIGGRPYTSCRAPGKVIINLDRWRGSVDHFVAGGVPLDTYRTYVINHEVGHELGHQHERCPGRGRPAPVMMQQTLFLNGCVANPWPYLDGRRYAGPFR